MTEEQQPQMIMLRNLNLLGDVTTDKTAFKKGMPVTADQFKSAAQYDDLIKRGFIGLPTPEDTAASDALTAANKETEKAVAASAAKDGEIAALKAQVAALQTPPAPAPAPAKAPKK